MWILTGFWLKKLYFLLQLALYAVCLMRQKQKGTVIIMVDLRAKPYLLSDEDIAWVESTIAAMSDEEKVGQLFWQLTAGNSEEYLKELMEKYHLGGCRYNGMPDRWF